MSAKVSPSRTETSGANPSQGGKSDDYKMSSPFWGRSPAEACAILGCTLDGLTEAEATIRRSKYGANADAPEKRVGAISAILRRLLEPLSLILLAAGLVSAVTGDAIGGAIIVAILAVSIGLDTVQEGQAARTAEILRQSVALMAEAKRDGSFAQIAVELLVPGDVIRVKAGDIVPADALLLTSTALTSNEAALTGEPYPVEKSPGTAKGVSPSDANNAVFRGAVAQTGEATALVMATGSETVFGSAALALAAAPGTSPFQNDLRAYGLLTARLTIALVLVVFATHMAFGRPVLQSLLFCVALAVGLTPELLPMITTVTLARGAKRMAARKVIVKRLTSIHDLGAMTVLCTDKTGTLTSAVISLAESLDHLGANDNGPAVLGALAAGVAGDRGALDAALIAANPDAAKNWTLLSQNAFDYGRRKGSVLVKNGATTTLIVKGAPEEILACCISSAGAGICAPLDRDAVLGQVGALAERGLRSVAIASRTWSEDRSTIAISDECDLVYDGLVAFADPPKASAPATVARLAAAGVRLVILSGDDPVVVGRLAGLVGLDVGAGALSGTQIAALSNSALAVQVRTIDVFGRLTPDQKSRLIKALKHNGEVVGYLGDGINDAPALKAADIGLSVAGASGVAQAAADMIMLDSDLAVVADGVEEGRRTFANILKYVRMEASSNVGNMLSMAVASLFLPFLPMLPTQILLNNLLYDVSEIGIPFDTVRPEAVAQPQVWDMRALIRFAAIMGPLSSAFDLLTFGGLVFVVHAAPPEFRTIWFLESMATQILVIFIIRTNGLPWRDLPRPMLTVSSLATLAVAMALPFTPVAHWLGFQAPPLAWAAAMGVMVAAYLACAEMLKRVAIRPGCRKQIGAHAHPRLGKRRRPVSV